MLFPTEIVVDCIINSWSTTVLIQSYSFLLKDLKSKELTALNCLDIASLPGNNFETASSICFLGKFYLGKHHEIERRLDRDSAEESHGSFHEFLKDFQSRVWVTYRRGFACLGGTNLKSDTGWGCMLRTGQMMLATALQIHCFGRGDCNFVNTVILYISIQVLI